MSLARQQHWGIVGGGMLGLTLALRLAQLEQSVTLFEAAPHLGGLAGAWQVGDVVWDRHYHVTLLSDSHLRGLLRELELEAEIEWVETKTGAYTDGNLYSVSNTLEFLRFPPLSLLDKLRLGGTIFYASKIQSWERLERLPVDLWLSRWSGRRTFEKFWLPLLRAKLGTNYRDTSAAFIWATIQRLYAARRTGLKKEMFGYVPGGYARILERFAATLRERGVALRLGTGVREIKSEGSRVEVQILEGDAASFDRVVVTAAPSIAARLIPQLTASERATLLDVKYQGIVCASLVLQHPLTEFYVTNITDDWVPFTGVIEMSALVDPSHFGGRALVYLPRYLPSDDPFLEADDDEVEETFLKGLERMHPGFDRRHVEAFRISRVRFVMPVPTLGYSQRVPPIRTSAPGVYLVNSSQIVNGTLNVNETVALAETAMVTLTQGGDR